MAKPRTLANSVATGGPLENGDPTIADVTGLQTALDAKQASLVSGTNIKTINGNNVLGSGNLALAGVANEYQEFLSSGTWTKPVGVTWVYVEAIGGGGGARSAAFSGDNCQGGGGGEFTSMIMRAADVTSTVTVTVGAGGAGGPIGGDAGSAGGDSTFGAYVTGRGGIRGSSGAANTTFTGVPGGGGNIENIGGAVYPQAGSGGAPNGNGKGTIYGGAGGAGMVSTARTGGTSLYGGNGGNSVVSGAGQNGSQPGGGGGATGSSSFAAGSGGAGRVRVWAW